MVDAKAAFYSGIMSLVGAGLIWFGFNRMRRYQLINDTPDSKVRSIAMGLVEIHGHVVVDTYIVTPFSQAKCVYYRYEIKEYRTHSTGKSHHNSWDLIASGEKRIPFFIEDDTGKVYVDPAGAEFNVPIKKVFLQKAGLFGAINFITDALSAWDNLKNSKIDMPNWGLIPVDPKKHVFWSTVGDRKYFEYFIELEEDLFVLGTVANDSKVKDKVLIRKGENEKMFMISNRSEKEIVSLLKWQMIGSFVLGGALFVIGIVILMKHFGVI